MLVMKIMGIVVSYNTTIVVRKNDMVYIRQAVFNNFSFLVFPLKDMGKISIRLESLFKKYPGIKPFVEIKDPKKWQQELRDEWK